MISFILGTAVFFILMYLALIFESTALALLGFSVAAIVVLSFFYIHAVRRALAVRISIPISIAEKNRPFNMTLRFRNDFPFSVGRVKILLEYGEAQSDKRQRIWIVLENIPNGETIKKSRLSILAAGSYEFTVRRIRVYDMSGLFRLDKKIKGNTHALVLPDIASVPVVLGHSVRHFFGEAVVYDELQSGRDPGETFDVREFRDGDKLQRVHWKLSARMNELMVKEHSFPKACPIVMLLPAGAAGENGVLDWAAGISFSLMDAKCPHYVAWNSASRGDILRVRVDDEESFYLFMTAFMQDNAVKSDTDMLERYKEKYKGEQFIHLIKPVGFHEIYVDDELLTVTKPENTELMLK